MVTIAIAEDEQAAADKLTGYITRYAEENGADFKVSRFFDGVSLLQNYRPEFDVIFLDIEMPHTDGMTLAKKIRERDKVVTLIFVKNQVLPYLGDKVVGDITAADVKSLLNRIMTDGYAYSTAKKVYHILTDYFRYMTQEGCIDKNPMTNAPMIKKANYLASQNIENLPTCETVTVFTPEEIEKFRSEAYRCWGTGKRFYQQSAAYILMLNTGLRAGEALGLLNRDVDIENKVLHVRQGVKEVVRRDGMDIQSGTELRIGKLKTATSKRDVPLNSAAIEAINELRREFYFGEDTPLIPDENGDYTRPNNFRKRFHRILEGAGIEIKGLHSLRHTFATTLVNGVPQPDGTIKSLSPRQVADLLGHSTSEITEMYYVKKDTSRLGGITNGFEI